MKITKISSEKNLSILQDKTDWKKVYRQPQSTIDREAAMDTENPILKNVKFKHLNKK